jgi:hypothetical protein
MLQSYSEGEIITGGRGRERSERKRGGGEKRGAGSGVGGDRGGSKEGQEFEWWCVAMRNWG